MTPTPHFFVALRSALRRSGAPRNARKPLAVGAAIAAFSLIGLFAVVQPAPPSRADALEAYLAAHAQTLSVPEGVAITAVTRDTYSASAGIESLAASGTNYDWAKLVLLFGGWPITDDNVTVMVRWMRQENGADNWWNRNNPMNNGYGSGGGGGLGSYSDLVVAAQKAAENLQRNSFYDAIVAGFAASAPTQVTEQAIWASPWASSHYGNGTRWHTTPVPVVKAPADAW